LFERKPRHDLFINNKKIQKGSAPEVGITLNA